MDLKKKGMRIRHKALFFIIIIVLSISMWIINIGEKRCVFITITIPYGADAKEIAQILKDNGLIKLRSIFVIFVKLRGAENKLKAGWYRLEKGMGIGKVIDKLVKGEKVLCKVTIPEGFTLNKIARRLAKNGVVDEERFIELCYDKDFFERIGFIPKYSLEGYLFPDTYEIARWMNEEDIIRMMVERFKTVMIEKYWYKVKKKRFSIFEIVTLASIIEKEAKVDYERPLISAVYHNRLKKGLNLCACPTVLYALGEYKTDLSEEDLNINSPYNTYLYSGLPPGPICSPGDKSIQAAIFPKDVDYLYFISNGDGTHRFSSTFSQHKRAKRIVKEKKGL